MPRGYDYDPRDVVLGTDYVYLFTATDDYRTTFDALIADLSLATLDGDGKIRVEQLPDIVVTGGSGDVVGPSSVTTGNLAVYSGTSGKILGEIAIADRLLPTSPVNGAFVGYSGSALAWISGYLLPTSGAANGKFAGYSGGIPAWVDSPLPASGTTDDVLTWNGSAWVAQAPADASITSASIADVIEAESNVITDVTPDTYVLVIQDDGLGGWTVGKINIGGYNLALDPNAVVTTDASSLVQTTTYAGFADSIGLGTGDTVQFTAIELGHASDTTISRASAGVVAIEGTNVVLSGSTPQFTAIELSHATANTLSASGGVLSIEGHAAVTKDQTAALSAGFSQTEYAAGTKSSGTYTPDIANGAIQAATNGGAHTLAPPTASCAMIVCYTNNGSAGAITTSGFTKVDGDSFTTTNGHKFECSVSKTSVGSHLTVKAMQ